MIGMEPEQRKRRSLKKETRAARQMKNTLTPLRVVV